MKYRKVRIFFNAIVVILILLSRIIIRRKKRIKYYNPYTGLAVYIVTYYILLFIPIWRRKKTTPKKQSYAVQQ